MFPTSYGMAVKISIIFGSLVMETKEWVLSEVILAFPTLIANPSILKFGVKFGFHFRFLSCQSFLHIS